MSERLYWNRSWREFSGVDGPICVVAYTVEVVSYRMRQLKQFRTFVYRSFFADRGLLERGRILLRVGFEY